MLRDMWPTTRPRAFSRPGSSSRSILPDLKPSPNRLWKVCRSATSTFLRLSGSGFGQRLWKSCRVQRVRTIRAVPESMNLPLSATVGGDAGKRKTPGASNDQHLGLTSCRGDVRGVIQTIDYLL